MATQGTLTKSQLAAIGALLSPASTTIDAAAKAAGVSKTSLYRWLQEPAFAGALREAQGLAIDAAVRSLTALSEKAVTVINLAMTDPNSTPGVRLRAAGMALEMLLRLRDSADFERRLAALEGNHGES